MSVSGIQWIEKQNVASHPAFYPSIDNRDSYSLTLLAFMHFYPLALGR